MNTEEIKEVVEFTSQKTGFSARLIEKDYYCSLILDYLYSQNEIKNKLIFKGGTLLAKAYTDFFRLSEDLDFSVLSDISLTRAKRREFAELMRTLIFKMLKDLNLVEQYKFTGFNESRQYNAVFQYESYLGIPETIKFEVGLRNDVIGPPQSVKLKTLLIHAMKNRPILPYVEVIALSLQEAYAEKCRAALTRKDPAIRDFFDLWQAKKQKILPETDQFYNLVRVKLENDPSSLIDMSTTKKNNLVRQIKHELNNVLKDEIVNSFGFDEAWAIVLKINQDLSKSILKLS